MGCLATDEKICQLLTQMNPKGMDLLFDVYYSRLVTWANTFLNNLEESEDLVQDFLIYLWENKTCQRIIPNALQSFLYISVRNRCLHAIKKQGNQTFITNLEEINIANETYNTHYEEILAQIEDMIEQLPPQSHKIITAVFIQGMKYQDVANQFNVSLSTVKTLVRNSIKTLQQKSKNISIINFLYFLQQKRK